MKGSSCQYGLKEWGHQNLITEEGTFFTGNVEKKIRTQLQSRDDLLKDNAKAKPLLKQAKVLVTKIDTLEGKLHNPKAEVTYDILAQKGGAKLYSLLTFLYELVKDGDDAPTQGMREVYEEQFRELNQREVEWDKLRRGGVQQYNAMAKQLDLPKVVVPAGKEAAKK